MYRRTADAEQGGAAHTEAALAQRHADGDDQRAFDPQRHGQPRAVKLQGERHGDGAKGDREAIERRAPVLLPEAATPSRHARPRLPGTAPAHWPARRPRPRRRARRAARRRWRAAARCRRGPDTRCCRNTWSSCASGVQREDGDRRDEIGRQPPRGLVRVDPGHQRQHHRDPGGPAPRGRLGAHRQAHRHHRHGNQVDPDGHAMGFEDAERGHVVEQRAGRPARSTGGDASHAARAARAGSAGTGRRRA